MLRTFLISIGVSLFMCSSVFATHIVGGEIFYECLGGDEYLITLKVYRDCLNGEAPFDNPATISVYNSSGGHVTDLFASFSGSDVLDVVITNPCLQAPPNVCVEEAVYTIAADLPFIAGGYHIAYQRCCRNQSVANIINPGAQGSTYTVQIPEAALNDCNSSPYFNEFPPLALCVGDLLVFNHSATDPDGDQLVYSLCTPYHGGSQAVPMPSPAAGPPYTLLNWGGSYSSGYPIDANPQLSIDPVSGELTGVPTQQGQYVVGVCVEEYRNGQLLSVNNRDFQFNVVNCTSNIMAVIPDQAVFHDPCDGLEVEFGNNSINAQYYLWDFGVDGMLSDTSVLENPTYVFPDTGTYQVMLIANPAYACADTTIETVTVYEDIVAEIITDGNGCFDVNSFDFQAGGQFGPGASFLWEFENADPDTSFEMNPSGVEFDTLGAFQISLTITEAVCSDYAQVEINTYPRPEAYFHPEFFSGCNPLAIFIHDSSYSSTGHQILWDFGDGHEPNYPDPFHSYTEAGTYDLSLTIWTTEGCIDTSFFIVPDAVTVHPLPTGMVSAEPDTQSIFEPVFQFTGTSDDAVSCSLLPGTSDTLFAGIQSCGFEYIYSDTGNYFPAMIFTNQFGCTMMDTTQIRVEPEVRFYLPNAFTPNDDRLNDQWGPRSMGWTEFELWIFDRWGKLVFNTTDPENHWNGRFNNQSNLEPVMGVYSYRILARSVKYEVIRQSGSVTLLR